MKYSVTDPKDKNEKCYLINIKIIKQINAKMVIMRN